MVPAKIFLSYTSEDRQWAHWIGVTLRNNGYMPLVHEWEIGAGQNIARWMDESLDASDRLLGVFTDAYTKALYSSSERWSAYWDDPDGRKGFLVPVEVEHVAKWPPLTRSLKRLSLVGLSEAEAEKALLTFLKPPAPPEARPKFPGRVPMDSGIQDSAYSTAPEPRDTPRSSKEEVRKGLVEKTVFVSYRRADESWALAVFQNLTQHGYDVFIDYDGIASGNFETVIFENIRARAHFIVLLTPAALERCHNPNDWMRSEIETAIESRRNIVPLMLEGFDFGTSAVASQLTGKLAMLKEYNGLEIPKARFFSSEMERLRNRFLNVPVDAVVHSASFSAQRAATEQKEKASRALAREQAEIVERLPAKRPAWPGEPAKVRPWVIVASAAGVLTAIIAVGWIVQASLSQSYKKIACTGEYEGNCPGPHDLFYECDYYGSDDQIASQVCRRPSKGVRLKTVSGNRCGYSLIEITCN